MSQSSSNTIRYASNERDSRAKPASPNELWPGFPIDHQPKIYGKRRNHRNSNKSGKAKPGKYCTSTWV